MIFGYDLFELKKEHLTLLKKTYMSWNYMEHGAPTINPKRPYGNSNVYSDMVKILDLKLEDEDEDLSIYEALTEEQVNYLEILHFELQTAINIILHTQSFELGFYYREQYSGPWQKIKNPVELEKVKSHSGLNDINKRIETEVKRQVSGSKARYIDNLVEMGLDRNKLVVFSENELEKIYKRRREQLNELEMNKLDDLIRKLM